jgi:hypothetical protein
MKRTQHTKQKKLALKRAIVLELTQRELGRVDGGTCFIWWPWPGGDCTNPVYSA